MKIRRKGDNVLLGGVEIPCVILGSEKLGSQECLHLQGQSRYEKREGGAQDLKYRDLEPTYLLSHSYLWVVCAPGPDPNTR